MTTSCANARVTSRAWAFTWPNFTEEDILYLNQELATKVTYLVYGKETAPTTQMKHLQGFLYTTKRVSFTCVSKEYLKNNCHVEKAKGNFKQNYDYCTKEKDFKEFGVRPLDPKEKGEKEKERWKRTREMAESGNFDEIDDQIYICHIKALEWIHKRSLNQEDLKNTGDLKQRNYWFYGETGSGKSYCAHKLAELVNTELYLKMLNKWWDGYENQKMVLIEEIDPENGKYLSSLMKKWADKWKFTAECKGSVAKAIRPASIIVCSNYKIEECFLNEKDADAIKRRFTTIKISNLKPGEKDTEDWIANIAMNLNNILN